MQVEKIYIAQDGKEFRGIRAYADCKAYEYQLQEVQYMPLYDYLAFGDYEGNPLSMAHVADDNACVHYIHIKVVPDPLHVSDSICTMFDNILPYEFYDAGIVCEGKFVYTDGRWQDFEDIQQEFQAIQTSINRLCGRGGEG